MEKVKIDGEIFEINSINKRGNLLEIEFKTPTYLNAKDLSVIEVYTSGGIKCTEMSGFNTIYRTEMPKVTLSNNGSVYTEPIPVDITPPDPYIQTAEEIAAQLEAAKFAMISKSNELLEKYLKEHPLLYKDSKFYSVTKDKQNLLANNLFAYNLELQLGNPAPILEWNSTGEECTVWLYNDLVDLALSIKSYVKPFVSYQQSTELQIRACVSMDDIQEVVIDYEIVA